MARKERFTFILDADERRILSVLAERLQRSQSDSVRWLIRGAAQELEARPAEFATYVHSNRATPPTEQATQPAQPKLSRAEQTA